MANEEHPVYCPRCGSMVQAGDRFCGVCGAGVPPDTRDATPTQEIPTQVPPPPSVPSRRRNRKLINGVMVGVLLFLLLIGAGAMALANLGSGAGLLGGAEGDPAPSGTPHASGAGPEEQGPATPSSPDSPEATTSDPYGQSTEEMEAEARDAAEEYYRAVGLEDWDYTYDHLDAQTKSRFTREEWFNKNQFFADNGGVIYRIESAERMGTSSGLVVGVTLRLTYEDGSSSTRDTYFVYEDGEWKHAFGREEYDLFKPAVPYEEFVKAQ